MVLSIFRWRPGTSVAWPHQMVAAKSKTQETENQADFSKSSQYRNCASSGFTANPADSAAGEYSPSCRQLGRFVSCNDAANCIIWYGRSLHCQQLTDGADATYSYCYFIQWHDSGATRTYSGQFTPPNIS